ncbi:GNAT family N-acetyltransferase [Acidisphaera sp. L21]|uniref:GNAT family N-acetyltransferase n=1 Tax=Acidisphaera sp. L21 TaxID=1641851 RepID=UPI001C204812|nr:GNAT family N-acetyltransferase [Acidisphaera sp. L21]
MPAIVALMNHAYRGDNVDAGWNTEAAYMDGDRTSDVMLRQDIAANPAASLLIWRASDDALLGCVWLEPEAADVWYVGSLTVDPRVQNARLGRTLLAAAEDWVRQRGGRAIRMTVVNLRDTLLAWYGRRGYLPTGATEPFPYDSDRFGRPKRDDLHFVVLGKSLG